MLAVFQADHVSIKCRLQAMRISTSYFYQLITCIRLIAHTQVHVYVTTDVLTNLTTAFLPDIQADSKIFSSELQSTLLHLLSITKPFMFFIFLSMIRHNESAKFSVNLTSSVHV